MIHADEVMVSHTNEMKYFQSKKNEDWWEQMILVVGTQPLFTENWLRSQCLKLSISASVSAALSWKSSSGTRIRVN